MAKNVNNKPIGNSNNNTGIFNTLREESILEPATAKAEKARL